MALDIATLGAGSIIKGGIKTIGTELVEEGIEMAAKDAAKTAAKEVAEEALEKAVKEVAEQSSTRFITTADGVTTDLKPTLDRIASGERFPHRNDGSVFRNFPPRGQNTPLLPVQPQGYYREFVHPTPGATGPGAMRIVTGQGGEKWFTADHYSSFIPLH